MEKLNDQIMIKESYDKLRNKLNGEVISYTGVFQHDYFLPFKNFIENIKKQSPQYDNLYLLLKTDGGNSDIVERMVDCIYENYKYCAVIVFDRALSAGTVFALSTNEVFLDKYGVLGAIDSYVPKADGTQYPVTLQHLLLRELMEKDSTQSISQYDKHLLGKMDVPSILAYEKSDELTIETLTKAIHDRMLQGQGDTSDIKAKMKKLQDINHWKSHFKGIRHKQLIQEFPFIKASIYDDELKTLIESHIGILYRNYYEGANDLFLHGKEFSCRQSFQLDKW